MHGDERTIALGVLIEELIKLLLVANEDSGDPITPGGHNSALDHYFGTVVAPHGVNGDGKYTC
jgi:hypothetical protein